MRWPKRLIRRAQVARALNWGRERPEKLPDPALEPIAPRELRTIEELNSVCLFLGPYRNLTTLTASFLFLHPNCQVLNHAGLRVLEDASMNFIINYSEDKFRQFCHFAITMSQGGARGSYGGSIVLSHAFARHQAMRKVFQKRYGNQLLKQNIKSLVWKESELVSQLIRKEKIDLRTIFSQNRKLRFLMPIRNPLDCASSIVRLNMDKFYNHLGRFDVHQVLDEVLKEIRWFVGLKREFPDRFYYFYQDRVDEKGLRDLAAFLELEPEKRWLHDVLNVYQVSSTYKYETDLIAYYEKSVEKYFSDEPPVQDHLRGFAQTSRVG